MHRTLAQIENASPWAALLCSAFPASQPSAGIYTPKKTLPQQWQSTQPLAAPENKTFFGASIYQVKCDLGSKRKWFSETMLSGCLILCLTRGRWKQGPGAVGWVHTAPENLQPKPTRVCPHSVQGNWATGKWNHLFLPPRSGSELWKEVKSTKSITLNFTCRRFFPNPLDSEGIFPYVTSSSLHQRISKQWSVSIGAKALTWVSEMFPRILWQSWVPAAPVAPTLQTQVTPDNHPEPWALHRVGKLRRTTGEMKRESLWAGVWKLEKQCQSCSCSKHRIPKCPALLKQTQVPTSASPHGCTAHRSGRIRPQVELLTLDKNRKARRENDQECISHAASANLCMVNRKAHSMLLQRNWGVGLKGHKYQSFPLHSEKLSWFWKHSTHTFSTISKIIFLLSQDATWSYTGQVLKFNLKNAWICTRCICKEKS